MDHDDARHAAAVLRKLGVSLLPVLWRDTVEWCQGRAVTPMMIATHYMEQLYGILKTDQFLVDGKKMVG